MCIDAKRLLPGRPIIITFDDGYKDFIENAWPLLDGAGFTATLFIVTKYVGERAEWDRRICRSGEPIRLMGWDDLLVMRERGVDIQSHTAAHRDLLTQTSEEIARDGKEASDDIQRHLSLNTNSIAFPYGRRDARVLVELTRVGYSIGLNTTGRVSTLWDDPMDLPRFPIEIDDDLGNFAKSVLPVESDRVK